MPEGVDYDWLRVCVCVRASVRVRVRVSMCVCVCVISSVSMDFFFFLNILNVINVKLCMVVVLTGIHLFITSYHFLKKERKNERKN